MCASELENNTDRRALRHAIGHVCVAAVVLLLTAPALAQHRRVLLRSEYEDRLRAMWLGEVIANWTGLQTENRYVTPPFLTDANWGIPQVPGSGPLDFIVDQDPWLSDDDTNIEYVYLHLLRQHHALSLTPLQIAQGWIAHVNRFIWVSNLNARTLMGRGVLPPATSLGGCNIFRLQIDAQLTTECFGALCPGMPERALEMAHLPMRVTSAGYAMHASQFYAVLYSLATQVPEGLTGRERSLWLLHQARRYIPDTSKAADIVDFVLADFLANPDINDWEATRDRVYDRYQLHPGDHGYVYRGFTESGVNFAAGMFALLYGQGDYRRTVQIATLAGWDSDNATATLGGLIGLMLGYQEMAAQFPGHALSDRYTILVTRDNLPDYLPADPAAEDTLTLMASRMADIAEQAIAAYGGAVDRRAGVWVLPPSVPWGDRADADATPFNSGVREWLRSHNTAVRRAGGTVTATSSAGPSSPPFVYPYLYGLNIVEHLANGVEQDFSGVEGDDWGRVFYSTQNSGAHTGEPLTFTVVYDRPVSVATVRLIEGDHFNDPTTQGGWLIDAHPQLLVGSTWIDPPGPVRAPIPDAARPFQFLDWELTHPVMARGVRITGGAGGRDAFATVSELDALAPAPPRPPLPTFDLNHDRRLSIGDVSTWLAQPIDLDGDGTADSADLLYLKLAVRYWSASAATTLRAR